MRNVVALFHVLEKELEWRRANGRLEGFEAMQTSKPIVAVGADHPLEDEILMADYFRKSSMFTIAAKKYEQWRVFPAIKFPLSSAEGTQLFDGSALKTIPSYTLGCIGWIAYSSYRRNRRFGWRARVGNVLVHSIALGF